jgi:DNA-directed RNA polymerase subunit RPC12/RpoP
MTPAEKTRDATLRRVYGINLDEYRAILAAQGHQCLVCRKPLTGISNPVDHDHSSGVIRGIPCPNCNHRVIGRNRDWQIMQRVADYLRNPPAVTTLGVRVVPKKKPKRRRPTKAA